MVSIPERLKIRDMIVVDADVHVNDTPEALTPYCDMPRRQSLEALANMPRRGLDIPGFSPRVSLYPPIPGGQGGRSVNSAVEMHAELSALGIDIGVLFPDHFLHYAQIPDIEYAIALSHAYNRWLMEEWLAREQGLYGMLLACPQDPEDSAREIARYAQEGRIVGVYLPTAGVNPLWGHRKYDPIMAAAEAAELPVALHKLPVALHSVGIITPAFPCQLEQFENAFALQVLSHSFAMQANLVSIMHSGVPARYPRLKFAFTEAGVSWVPHMMWRMDRYYDEFRRIVPFLEKRPSEYMKERMWFATQPVEEPDNPQHLVETIRHYDGENRTLFASDWPHHDFDHPKAVINLPMPEGMKRKILGENALELFGIPAPAGKIA